MILLEYQNIKSFNERLCSKLVWRSICDEKVRNTVPRAYVISDLETEEIVRTFYVKQFQKTNQKEFRVEKVIKEKKP